MKKSKVLKILVSIVLILNINITCVTNVFALDDKKISTFSSSIIKDDLLKIVSLINQQRKGSSECKAAAIAQSLNIIFKENKYAAADMGSDCASNDNGKVFEGIVGNEYLGVYKQDRCVGSAEEQKSIMDGAIAKGLPSVILVHN